MKIIVSLNYYEYIFDVDEKEEAMKFALNAALKSNNTSSVSIRVVKEEDDNEE